MKVYMDPRLWIYEHFDLICNPNLMWNITKVYIFIFKNYGECKMQLDSNGFSTFKIND